MYFGRFSTILIDVMVIRFPRRLTFTLTLRAIFVLLQQVFCGIKNGSTQVFAPVEHTV